jgi:ribosomal RNA-processing protein 36
LVESRKTELQVLRESLKKARKMLASSPSELRSDREEEVRRLEGAVKRVESMVDRDRTARVEQEVLSRTKKEEAERRKQGKGKWFLKKGEIQRL